MADSILVHSPLREGRIVQDIESSKSEQQWLNEPWDTQSLSAIVQDMVRDERAQSMHQAIKANKFAILWSLAISTCVIMEGYQTSLLGNFFAYPAFQRAYGEPTTITNQTPSGFSVPAAWQVGLNLGGGVGIIVGIVMNGWLLTRFGPRKVLLYALVTMSGMLLIIFFSRNKPMLLAGELLFATTVSVYASETLPLKLRDHLISYINIGFITGQLLAGGVLRGLANHNDQWAYRIPWALQWVWPVILIPLIWFAPESPWHLVRQNKLAEAEMNIRRLQRSNSCLDLRKELALIVYTNNLEQQLSVGASYKDCFQGFERHRTEIAMIVSAAQLLCGALFAYGSSYFFQQIGLNISQTYSLALGSFGISLAACCCSWFFVLPYFDHRQVYLIGTALLAIELCAIGILNVWTYKQSVAYVQAVLTLVWTFTFQISAGQLCWIFPAQIGSTRLRSKTICLARSAFQVAGLVGGTLEGYLMNPGAWNLKGYTGFVWGGCAVLVWIWAFFRLPEIKGRPFHELDILFVKRTPARKFKITKVTGDSVDNMETVMEDNSKNA